MNKNKLIFSIIWVVAVLLIIWWVIAMNKASENKPKDWQAADFSIWTYNLDKDKLGDVIKEFKSLTKDYEKKNIVIENFSNYADYKDALLASIIAWKAPDIFMLNNHEKSYLENHVSWINPSIINPSDFRKNYKTFFVDDLVRQTKDEDWNDVDFVLWIPVWYETLWIYYNRKFNIKSSDLDSWAWVSNVIDTIKEREPDIIPLWVMNWSIDNNPDILTQFFMLSDAIPMSYDKVTELWIKEAFWSYFSYLNNENIDKWDSDSSDPQYYDVDTSWRTNLELFSEWNEAMIIGYTSMINSLDESWFNNSFLFAEPFPHYFSWKGKTLVRYDYFAVNQDTKNESLAFDFLAYLWTKDWSKKFLDNFTYLLPALVTLEQDKLQEKIHPSYNLTLSDFYKPKDDSLLSSFDKGIVSLYDDEINDILKDDYSYVDKMKKLQKIIACKYKKLYNIENLSTNCDSAE